MNTITFRKICRQSSWPQLERKKVSNEQEVITILHPTAKSRLKSWSSSRNKEEIVCFSLQIVSHSEQNCFQMQQNPDPGFYPNQIQFIYVEFRFSILNKRHWTWWLLSDSKRVGSNFWIQSLLPLWNSIMFTVTYGIGTLDIFIVTEPLIFFAAN